MNPSTFHRVNERTGWRLLWLVAFGSMVLAAATGLLYRGHLLHGWMGDLALSHIRHAHSHLMLFSWVTPVPMLYFTIRLTRPGKQSPSGLIFWTWWVTLTGVLAYVPFLFYGYQSIPLGGASLPASVILSGLVMIGWYGFSFSWFQAKRRVDADGAVGAGGVDAVDSNSNRWPGGRAMELFEVALALLVLSSLGAWGVAATTMGGAVMPELASGLTHLFLALFTQGWALVALLAIVWGYLEERVAETTPAIQTSFPPSGGWVWPILLGAPLTFPLGMSAESLSEVWFWSARAGSLLLAIGLWSHLRSWRAFPSGWTRPLGWVAGVVALVALLLLLTALLPHQVWVGDAQLRLFFLHLLLLGAVTSLFLWIRLEGAEPLDRAGWWVVTAWIVLMLLLLLGNSSLLGGWMPGTPWQRTSGLFWSSAGLVVTLLWLLGRDVLRWNRSGPSRSGSSRQENR